MLAECTIRHQGRTIVITASSPSAARHKALTYYPHSHIITVRNVTQHNPNSIFANIANKTSDLESIKVAEN